MIEQEQHRWPARPLLGALLHVGLVVVPVALGIGVGLWVRRALPADGLLEVPSWVIAGIVGMAAVWVVQPLARRLLPLSWLLKMGLVFPTHAPSRLAIARQAGRLHHLEEQLAGTYEGGGAASAQRSAELILSLVAALTAHDRRTRGHAERTRVFTDLLSEQLGLPAGDRDRLRWASLLHDIGKLDVSRRILNKPGRPTAQEWQVLRGHPEAGDRMIAPMRDWLGEWADVVVQHHERWDGQGYPAGLAGDAICLGARIVSVADAYDVMTAARSYRRPTSAAAAREELVRCAGSQFDPAVVRAFLLIPLPRLRWALGPFAWLGQLPGFREVAHGGASASTSAGHLATAAPAVAGAAAVATGMVVASQLPSEAPSPVVLTDPGDDDDADVRAATGEGPADPSGVPAADPTEVPDPAPDVPGDPAPGGPPASDEPSGAAEGPERSDPRSVGPHPSGSATDPASRSTDPAPRASDPAPTTATETPRTDATSDPERPPADDDSPPPTPGADDPADHVARVDPASRDECMSAGWEHFGFENQGQCVRFVVTGEDSRGD